MTHGQIMARMKGKFHYKSTLHLRDGSTVVGYFQPPGDDTAYLTPLENKEGKAIEVKFIDIVRIDVEDWPTNSGPQG
jgi:hypothetical protein